MCPSRLLCGLAGSQAPVNTPSQAAGCRRFPDFLASRQPLSDAGEAGRSQAVEGPLCLVKNLLLAVFRSLVGISVSLGCCNKVLQTRWLISLRNWFLTALESGSLRSGCQHGQGLVRALFWVADSRLLSVSSCGRRPERGSKLSWLVTRKDTDATHECAYLVTSPNPNYLPKAPPPNPIILRERVTIFIQCEFWGDTNTQCIAVGEMTGLIRGGT